MVSYTEYVIADDQFRPMRAPDLCDAAPVIIPSRRGHTVLVVELFVKASPSASFRKFQSSSEVRTPLLVSPYRLARSPRPATDVPHARLPADSPDEAPIMRTQRWWSAVMATAWLLAYQTTGASASVAESKKEQSEGVECSVTDGGDGVCFAQIGEPASESFFQTDTMFRTRQIAFKFVAKEQSEGVGARVRRSIGSHKLRNLDPFLMLDEFNVGLPGGFPDHPHRGFETVTYVLPTSTGHMLHEDFLGNKGDLRPGDLQWMTPGSGIVHAEMPATTDPAHGLQLWINLPKARKTMPPKYQEVNRESVPHVFNDDKTVEAIVFAGEVFGQKGPIDTEAPVTYIHFIMKKDSKLEYRVPEGHNTFVYTLKGDGVCAGQEVTAHEAIVMEVEGEGVEFSTSSDEGVEFIVMSGQPLNEPVVQYGPFVMTTKEEIHQTIYDYQSGKNGFENAPVWESEIKERRYSY